MRPQCGGAILSFERVAKCKIPLDSHDRTGIRNVINFFWLVKDALMKSQEAVTTLMESNDDNIFLSKSTTSLPKLLKPMPIKPSHDYMCDGIAQLDPVSIIF
ncbi:unnamed protein product [Absidia cylindrospora]